VLAALLFPKAVLKLVFGSAETNPITMFFTRHWGALLFVVCSLTIYAAFFPDTRGPILTAAAFEKLVIFILTFFGKLTRTPAMAAIAITDGVLAVLFTLYLIGH
jgi:hypothetical protein